MTRDLFALNLADFALGDFDDPLLPPEDFVEWRRTTERLQVLFERCLLAPAAAGTTLAGPSGPVDVINMASLDYLGLCQHPEVVAAQQRTLARWGTGACGVPVLSGMTALHRALEARCAALTGQTGAMLFSSGYAAAMSLPAALLRRGDVAVLDERAHISWMDGVRTSGARLVTFAHNDPADLDAALERHAASRRLVIVDGLYSMDGDLADLPRLLDVTDAHGVGMVVDEAHSIFALGSRGGGATEHFGVTDRVRVVMGTFSKALSQVGGFLAGDADLIDYLRYYARPYVFSSALPPAVVAGIDEAMAIAERSPDLRERVRTNARYFREGLHALGLDTGTSETWVVPIVIGSDRQLLYEGVLGLMERGLFVAPVDFPAVAEDAVRIRAAVSAAHSTEDLDRALALIEELIALPLRGAR